MTPADGITQHDLPVEFLASEPVSSPRVPGRATDGTKEFPVPASGCVTMRPANG